MTTTTLPPPPKSALPPPSAVLSMLEEGGDKEENGGVLLRDWNIKDNVVGVVGPRLEKSSDGGGGVGLPSKKKVIPPPPPAFEMNRCCVSKNKDDCQIIKNQQAPPPPPLPVAQVLNLFRSSFIEPLFYAGVGVPVHDAASAVMTAATATPKQLSSTSSASNEVEGQFVGTSTIKTCHSSPCLLHEDSNRDASIRASSLHNNNNNNNSKKKEKENNHRRRIFKKHKNKHHQQQPTATPTELPCLPPPPSLTTTTTPQTSDEAEFVILDYELIATECSPEEEEEYQRCMAEALKNERTCGTVAQSGMRKSVNRVKKFLKNRRAREKVRRDTWERERMEQQQQQHPKEMEDVLECEENVNISERSATSTTSTNTSTTSKKGIRRRIFKRHKNTTTTQTQQQPPVPPMATCVPAQLVGYTTASHTLSPPPCLLPPADDNLDAASAAAYYAALADRLADMAEDGEVVRIQNITREVDGDEQLHVTAAMMERSSSCASLVDVPLREENLMQEIDKVLTEEEQDEEDYKESEVVLPEAKPIVWRKESVIQESQQLILEARELIRQTSEQLLKIQLREEEVVEDVVQHYEEEKEESKVMEPEEEVVVEESQVIQEEEEESQVIQEEEEEEELPIIEEVERVYNNNLKVLLVGSSSSGKSTLASSLLPSPPSSSSSSSTFNKRKRGLNVQTYTTPNDDDNDDGSNVQINLWDLPSNTPNHPLQDTSSLFYSKNGLYILPWDGAVSNPQSFSRSRQQQRQHFQEEEEEEEEEDFYTLETATQKANKMVERDIDSQVLPILQSIIEGGKGEGSVVVPVMTHADSCLDHDDVVRRCRLFQRRLYYFMKLYEKKEGVILPKIYFGKDEEEMIITLSMGNDGYQEEEMNKLRQTIQSLATLSSSGRSTTKTDIPFKSHLNRHIPRLTVTIQQVIQSLQVQNYKIISTSNLLQKIQEHDDEEEEHNDPITNDVSSITSSLEFLSSTGQILYFQDSDNSILNDFVILDFKWLTSAVSCILSQNLKRELVETMEFMNGQVLPWERRSTPPLLLHEKEKKDPSLYRSTNTTFLEEKKMELEDYIDQESFLSSGKSKDTFPTSAAWNLLSNCAAITSYDANMMWQSMSFMREAVEKAYSSSSSNSSSTASLDYEEHSKEIFSYLHALLVHHGVFVPLDNGVVNDGIGTTKVRSSPRLFLLPSLFTETVPSNIWSYKTSDAWNTTLSHSWLFRDVVLPTPNFMAQIMASVLKDVTKYTTSRKAQGKGSDNGAILQVQQFHCWKSAFLLELCLITKDAVTNECTMSKVEIFAHLDSVGSKYCVASDVMADGMRRLVVSAKGQVGCGGRRIWEGGYDLVLRSVNRLVNENISPHHHHQKLPHKTVERDIACPQCLALHHHSVAALLKHDHVLASSKRKDGGHIVRCRRGHALDSAALCGVASQRVDTSLPLSSLVSHENSAVPTKAVKDLMGGVVLVGLWDGDKKEIVGVGTGFIADRKQGLVITASHVLMEIRSGHKKFGRNYFGLKHGKAVIGVIPRASSPDERRPTKAVFRYFAEIVAKDVEHMDACVLRITTRMEEDVGGQGEGCGDQPEIPLMNDLKAIKAQKLQQLHMTRKFAIEEGVRVLGFNQGGEGLVEQGAFVHRTFDFVRGYVSEEFENDINVNGGKDKIKSIGNGGTLVEQMMTPSLLREPVPVGTFNPTKEIVVRCPTIPGHSGGPCVNHDGRVIGILSRADPTERERCYLVPTSELKVLMEKARAVCDRNPMDVMGELWT